MRAHPLLSGLVIVGLLIAVSACGFQLRGGATIAERFNPLYIERGELQTAQLNALKNSLRQSNAQLQASSENANRLTVSLATLKPQKIARSSLADVEILRLSMRLEFQIKTSSQEFLIDDEIVHYKEIELDSANVLSHQTLIKQSYQDLEGSLFRSMIYRLKR